MNFALYDDLADFELWEAKVLPEKQAVRNASLSEEQK